MKDEINDYKFTKEEILKIEQKKAKPLVFNKMPVFKGRKKIFNSVVEDISKGMKKGDEITVEGIYDMPNVVIHKR